MKTIFEQTFEEDCMPPAMNAAGDRLLVPLSREVHLLEISGEGSLAPGSVLPLPLARAEEQGEDTEPALTSARAVFIGDERAVIVGEAQILSWTALTLDLVTGKQLASFANTSLFPIYPADPILLSPHHLLVSTLETAICLELPSLREVFRIRTYDEEYATIGEDDVTPDEQIAHGGVAWEAENATLHVLWRAFNENNLQGYRLDLEEGTSTRLYRRGEVCGDDGAGLCLDPDGEGLTLMIQTMDQVILFAPGETEPPRLAPLGFLLWTDLTGEERGRLPLDGELRRDFSWFGHQGYAPDGTTLGVTGYRFSTEDQATPPIYIGPGRILVGTPSGLLIEADREAGTQTIVHDLGGSLTGLRYHAPTNRLFAACENRLIVLEP